MRLNYLILIVSLCLIAFGCDGASSSSPNAIDTTPLTSAEQAEMQGQLEQAADDERNLDRPEYSKGKARKKAPRSQMEMESQD